jgi:hypothetical protein
VSRTWPVYSTSSDSGALDSRNTGRIPGAEPPGLHYYPNHRLPAGDKKALRGAKKISNAHIFEAVVSRSAAQNRLIDELLGLFGGRTQPVMSHLIESGKLTFEDVKGAEKTLKRMAKERLFPRLPQYLLFIPCQ